MLKRIHLILAIIVTFGPAGSVCVFLNGETSVVESYKKQERELSQKRFKQKKWSGEKESNLTRQTFPFKHWNKNYSSIGSQKWDYSVEKTSEKKRFEIEMIHFPTKDVELSEWQGHLANLKTRAQISTDVTARIIQDKRIYEMMLQRAESQKDTGKLVSLRDINRFQFRKNRSKEGVPTTKAGFDDKEAQ